MDKRYAAEEAPEKETEDVSPKGKKLNLEEVKISFSAPPKNVKQTFNIKEKQEFEQNFQWVKYAVVVSNEDKTKWCTCIFPLEPWGTRRKAAPELYASDHKGSKLEGQQIEITSEEIEKNFAKLLSDPKLNPNLPESMVTYLNAPFMDPATKRKIIDPKGKYTPTEFKNTFEDSLTENGTHFYILVTKSGDMKTPFGDKVPEGTKAPPKSKGPEEVTEQSKTIPETKEASMDDIFRSAVKAAQEKKSQIDGGFSIVRDLYYDQHKKQQKKKKKD